MKVTTRDDYDHVDVVDDDDDEDDDDDIFSSPDKGRHMESDNVELQNKEEGPYTPDLSTTEEETDIEKIAQSVTLM